MVWKKKFKSTLEKKKTSTENKMGNVVMRPKTRLNRQGMAAARDPDHRQ